MKLSRPRPAANELPGSRADLTWKQLPSLPDEEGFAGMYAGVSNGALLAAGGANFPEPEALGRRPQGLAARPWCSRWRNRRANGGPWASCRALAAHGVSITADGGLLCVWRANSERPHFADCFVLKWDGLDIARQAAGQRRPSADGTSLRSAVG